MRRIDDRQKEKWAFLPSTEARNTNLAIFVHGFGGGHLSTWGNLADLLARNADTASPFKHWDYLFLGYSTISTDSYLDIAGIIDKQARYALEGRAPFQRAYRRLSLFGHSLGTLGIRQFLCMKALEKPSIINQLHRIVLFGSPLNGSWLALARIGVLGCLKPNSPELRMLRKWTGGAHGVEPWPRVRLIVGSRDWVVGSTDPWMVDWAGDLEKPDSICHGHISMTKAWTWKDCTTIDLIGEGLR